MNKSIELRKILISTISKIISKKGNGVFLRRVRLLYANDIDLYFPPTENPRDFLSDFEMELFDRHEIQTYYDFTNNDAIKIEVLDLRSGDKDHIDLWYCRSFPIGGTTYLLNRIDRQPGQPEYIESNQEAALYILHSLQRGITKTESFRKKISEYLHLCKNEILAKSLDSLLKKETLTNEVLDELLDYLEKDDVISRKSQKECKRKYRKKLRRQSAIIAVLGADGVGKTTTIGAIKNEITSQKRIKVRWEKFRRVYHKSLLYRKIRNFNKKKISDPTLLEKRNKKAALLAAKYRLPLMKAFLFPKTIVFIDRYSVDLGIDRKISPISFDNDLLTYSEEIASPDGIILLRADPKTIYERKGEMPVENVKEYYRYIIRWAFNNEISFLSSISTETIDKDTAAKTLGGFLVKKVLK
jgi:thymidylate kinase